MPYKDPKSPKALASSRKAALKYYHNNKEKQRLKNKKYRERIKRECIEHYGGTPPKCACCGEDEYEFLTIDHIFNDGTAERKKFTNGGHHNYRFIKNNNFPERYQILCYNCNCARGKRNNDGICPHKKKSIHIG